MITQRNLKYMNKDALKKHIRDLYIELDKLESFRDGNDAKVTEICDLNKEVQRQRELNSRVEGQNDVLREVLFEILRAQESSDKCECSCE